MLCVVGVDLAAKILARLKHYGLDIAKVRGEGFDGGSNMAGIKKGVQAEIQKKQPKALYVRCYAHSVNTIVRNADESTPFQTFLAEINKMGKFFGTAKRREFFCPSVRLSKWHSGTESRLRNTVDLVRRSDVCRCSILHSTS